MLIPLLLICGSLLCGAPVLLKALGGEMGREWRGSQGVGGNAGLGGLQGPTLKPEPAGWTSVCFLGRVPSHTWLLSGAPGGAGAGVGRHTHRTALWGSENPGFQRPACLLAPTLSPFSLFSTEQPDESSENLR